MRISCAGYLSPTGLYPVWRKCRYPWDVHVISRDVWGLLWDIRTSRQDILRTSQGYPFAVREIIAHLHRRENSNLPLIFIANIFFWIPISFSISIRSFIVFHAFRIRSVTYTTYFSIRNKSLWLTTITFERAVERQRCKMLHFPIARRRYCHYTCLPSDLFSLTLLSPTPCSMLAQWRDCSI